MKHVCRRCITAFSSEQVLSDHIKRCIKQKPANIGFSRKDKIMFEDHHMKVPLPLRIFAGFQYINQPNLDPEKANILFSQIPIAAGYYVVSPFGNEYKSCFWTRQYKVVC